MRLFLDTAELQEIEAAARTGLIDGVTTNPTLIARTGRRHRDVIEEIARHIQGDISIEVLSEDQEGMLREAEEFVSWTSSAVVKLPMTVPGLQACKRLAEGGIRTNVTLCFSLAQALLIAKAGATYCSPFLGRLDDLSLSGLDFLEEVVQMYRQQRFGTTVLAASIRSPFQAANCARVGAGACTVPWKLYQDMYTHPLTAAGLETFRRAKVSTRPTESGMRGGQS